MFRKIDLTRLVLSLSLCAALLAPASAQAGSKFGGAAGFSSSPDQFVLGAQAEFGRVFETARFAPSADIGFGQSLTVTTFNADVRWYLGNLPDTKLQFYGAAGPTLTMVSASNGGNGDGIGLSLTAGMKIPMKSRNQYNVEMRFGFGDVPDFKMMFRVNFGK